MSKDYLDQNGLLYFWQKIKTYFSGTATPLMDGTAATGSSSKFAREDHVHPTDTSRAPLASPGFTGNPTAPTQSASDDSTKLATTEFVHDVVSAMTSGVSGVKGDAEATYRTGDVNLTPANLGIVDFTGATTSAAGDHGLVPAPASGETTKLLWSDGNWKLIKVDIQDDSSNGSTARNIRLLKQNTSGTTEVSSAYIPIATSSRDGFESAWHFNKVESMQWGAEVNVQSDWNQADSTADDFIKNKPTIPTVPGDFTGATSSAAGAHGLVPAPASGDQWKILFGDAFWKDLELRKYNSLGRQNFQLEADWYNGSATAGAILSVLYPDDATSSCNGFMSASDKAKLDSISMTNGVIDASVLPSYVDDVIEAYPVSGSTALSAGWLSATSGGTALTPETGKIYVLMDDWAGTSPHTVTEPQYAANSTFRWSGSTYVVISDSGLTCITNAEIDAIIAS